MTTTKRKRRARGPRKEAISGKMRGWIQNFGELQLALALGVTAGAVNHWLTSRSRPDVKRIHEIIRLSDGALTFDDIYTPTPRDPGASKSKPKQENTHGRHEGAGPAD